MGANLVLKVIFLTGLVTCGIHGNSFSHMANRDVITLFTGPNRDFSQFTLTVTDRDFVSFRVRACQNAHLLISEVLGMNPEAAAWPSPMDHSVVASQVIIGSTSNTETVVMDAQEKNLFKSASTPKVIDCNDYRQFWLSWRNQTLKLGRGPTFDEQIIITLDDRSLGRFIAVNSIAFSSGIGTTGMWQIDENSGYSSKLLTPPTSLFSKLWRSVEYKAGWFAFSVKATNNAMIGLGTESGIYDYKITLGLAVNTRSSIVKNDKVVAGYHGAVLNSLQWRQFWVSWESGVIQLGRGRQRNVDVLMKFEDSDYQNVGHIGFTSALGAEAEWVVRETSENEIVLNSPLLPGQNSPSFFLSAQTSEYVPFHVQACSDATIDFTQQKGWDDDSTIHVQLGAQNNTKIIIGTSFSPNITEISKPGLLDCNQLLEFWASWKIPPLTMGIGPYQDSDIIFTFGDSVVPELHSMAFSNGKSDVPTLYNIDESVGCCSYGCPASAFSTSVSSIVSLGLPSSATSYCYALFPFVVMMHECSPGDQMEVYIPPDLPFGQLFLTARGQTFWTFTMTQKGGVQILLTEALDASPHLYYQISFGMVGKTLSITRSVVGSQKTSTGNIPIQLDENIARPFWISWYSNTVEVGEGHRYGSRSIVSLSAGSPYDVNVISIGSEPTVYGLLQAAMDQDDLLSIKIPNGSSNLTRWFRLGENVNWMYLQLANEGVARLSLSTWYRDAKSEEYVLSFNEDGKNQVVLRRKTQLMAESAIRAPWNKQDMRDFWISWEDNKLSVGSTRYKGADPFFSNLQLTDTLRGIGFYPEPNATVEWLIPHTFGPEATVYTDSNMKGENWFKVTHRTGLVFGVQACKEASIYLTASMYTTNWEPYVVQLGTNGNLLTSIYEAGVQKMWVETRDILSCDEERYFWITWYNGAISVGKGQQVGQDHLLTWHGLAPHYITAVTMATKDTTGKWRLGFLGGSLDPKPPPPPPSHKPESSGLSGGAIAGIVIGSLIFAALIGSVIFVLLFGVPERVRRIVPQRTNTTPGLPTDQPEHFDNPIKYDNTDYGDPHISGDT